jgi:hypothetical protein
MVRPERFELPTLWFVAKYSIQLSYGRTVVFITEPKIDYQAFGCYAIPEAAVGERIFSVGGVA